jgi:dienelactone hydrolase
MKQVSIQSTSIDQISVLIISPTEVKNAPLVFFVHGVASDKRQGIPLGYEMANKGIIFISLDTILRGERNDQEFDPEVGGDFGSVYPEEIWLDEFFTMVRMVKQTALDINALIDHYKEDPRVDVEKIGFAGYSMGGWAAFYSSSINPNIKATAAIAGMADFEQSWGDMILECSTYPEWTEILKQVDDKTAQRTAYIREMNPITYLVQESLNPLLMICGDLDQRPKKSCLDLYGKIDKKNHRKTDHLKLSIHDGIDHQLTLPMAEETAAWFEGIFSK